MLGYTRVVPRFRPPGRGGGGGGSSVKGSNLSENEEDIINLFVKADLGAKVGDPFV